jgi:hypothetical protein
MPERVVRERTVFSPVTLSPDLAFTRADLEIYQINTFRPSFVSHVFFNDADVTGDVADADPSARPSYAGRFALFGHQRCVGDEGHCDVPTTRRRFDDRPSSPLTRAFRRVVVTDALRRALADGDQLMITVVTSATVDQDVEYEGALLDVAGLQIATYL